MKKLNKNDLMDIIYGSAFFGGGGGGSLEDGLKLLEEIEKLAEKEGRAIEIEMEEVSEMGDYVSTMVAALGSPIATKGKTFADEAVNAILGMKKEAEDNKKTLKYIYSGEQGGGNTMLPLYAAYRLKMPVLNVDGNGRAVPELNTGLQVIHDIPTSPLILASELGDTIVGRTQDPCDGKACEKIARYMCQAYGQGIGFAAWMMDQKDHEKSSAVGQMDITMEVGRVLRTRPKEAILYELGRMLESRNFQKIIELGTITKIEMDVSGGFDAGTTTIKVDGTGDEYKVLFLNENLVIYGPDGKALATVPTIISIIDMEHDNPIQPLSNSEIQVGQKIAIVKIDAYKTWYSNPKGYECWKQVLIDAGYCDVRPQVK